NFCWPNESQKAGRLPVGLLPQFDRDWAEPGPELIRLERGEPAEGVHAPFVKNGDGLRNLCSPSHCWAGFFVRRSLHSRTLPGEQICSREHIFSFTEALHNFGTCYGPPARGRMIYVNHVCHL